MQDIDAVDLSRADLALTELDDGDLLDMARAGHQDAYAALFARYSYAAHRLARHLGQKEDSDDVVSEAFAQVLDLLGRGRGPDRAFRAYLFTTVRHECARRAKARQRVMPTDDLRQIDSPVEFGDGQLDDFERTAIRAAYESLPPRWRTVLWHLDVEGRKPQELGPLLDLSPNSVSALVYRARSGLRQAYLQRHVNEDQPVDSRTCSKHRAKLSGFVRRTLSGREQERIHAHLESCQACMAIYLDLEEVNRDVGLINVKGAAVVSVAGVAAATLLTQPLLFAKGIAVTVAAPVAAAAFASSTLVGAGTTTYADPEQQSVIVKADAPGIGATAEATAGRAPQSEPARTPVAPPSTPHDSPTDVSAAASAAAPRQSAPTAPGPADPVEPAATSPAALPLPTKLSVVLPDLPTALVADSVELTKLTVTKVVDPLLVPGGSPSSSTDGRP